MPEAEKPKEEELVSIGQEKAPDDSKRADPDVLKKAAAADRVKERAARQGDQHEIDHIREDLGIKPVDIEGFDNGVRTMLEQMDTLLKEKDQVLVSVAGKTGSGKTVFANKLRGELSKKGISATVISTDDFYKDGESQLDLEKLQSAIHKLQQGESVGRLQPAKVIIVEGLQTVADSTLGQKADSRAFIEVPFRERIARRLLRDEQVGFRTIRDSLTILAQLSADDLEKFKQFEANPDLRDVKYLVNNDYVAPDEPVLYIDQNSSSLVFSVAGEVRENVPIEQAKIQLLVNEIGIEVR